MMEMHHHPEVVERKAAATRRRGGRHHFPKERTTEEVEGKQHRPIVLSENYNLCFSWEEKEGGGIPAPGGLNFSRIR